MFKMFSHFSKCEEYKVRMVCGVFLTSLTIIPASYLKKVKSHWIRLELCDSLDYSFLLGLSTDAMWEELWGSRIIQNFLEEF